MMNGDLESPESAAVEPFSDEFVVDPHSIKPFNLDASDDEPECTFYQLTPPGRWHPLDVLLLELYVTMHTGSFRDASEQGPQNWVGANAEHGGNAMSYKWLNGQTPDYWALRVSHPLAAVHLELTDRVSRTR